MLFFLSSSLKILLNVTWHESSRYVKEGSFVTVMGMLCKENDVVMIVQPPEPISIGCLWLRCLLPNDVDGLILKFSATDSVATPYNQESGH